tara:strand:- start:326 stop:571 length:246 start_codon:yes stop_codon:yes gene_type:complete
MSEIYIEERDGQSALIIARQGVVMSNRQDARALAVLAVAQALTGSMADARATASEALAKARETGDVSLIDMVEARVSMLFR